MIGPTIEEELVNRAIARALVLVQEELRTALSRFPAFNSAHEGLAVLMEELEELKAEVFRQPQDRSIARMYQEAIQVAAMAIRFMVDVCPTREVLNGE